uniref:C2 domain-containing protein n=1 Tax=Fundulus heteroclitus TaxID=8078 RepID=A0A3Q2QPS3_FUNHE
MLCLQPPEAMASSIPLIVLLLCSVGVAHSDLRVYNLRATGLRPDQTSSADGFVKVYCGSRFLGQTHVYNNHPNPSWPESFSYPRAKHNDNLRVRVYDKDVVFDDELGSCSTRIRRGNSNMHCSLRKGGTLFFSYSFS